MADERKWSPGPWHACKDGECSCKMVWSLPGDFPIFTGRSADDRAAYVGEAHTFMADQYPDMVYASISEETARANARLIAAAPVLAEAADEAMDFLLAYFGQVSAPDDVAGWSEHDAMMIYRHLRAALASAEGRS